MFCLFPSVSLPVIAPSNRQVFMSGAFTILKAGLNVAAVLRPWQVLARQNRKSGASYSKLPTELLIKLGASFFSLGFSKAAPVA